MRVLDLYRDYGVEMAPDGHKHHREGWVNCTCPFCVGNPGYHLGYNLDGNYYHCHRCGGHFTDVTVSKLLTITLSQANVLIKKYGGTTKRLKTEPKVKVNLRPYRYPAGDLRLHTPHIRYLEGRGFDPEKLQHDWDITGTGPVAVLDDIDYSKRLLAPISWKGEEVSFQTRDVTGRHPQKYLACPKAREIKEHQKILYGKSFLWGQRGFCVEGITDVWRLGYRAFAVFGIDFTPSQVREIVRHFKEVVVVFDPEPQAQAQADKLVAELQFRGVEAWKDVLSTDPAEMTQSEADYYVRQWFPHGP